MGHERDWQNLRKFCEFLVRGLGKLIVHYASRDENGGMHSERQFIARGRRGSWTVERESEKPRPYAEAAYRVSHDQLSVTIIFGQVLRTVRELAWPFSARGAYTILSDEDMEIGGLSDFNYCWHAVMGGTGGGAPDCHETNLKCSINKFCHEMRHDLWR